MADCGSETRKRQNAAQLLLDRNAFLIHTLNELQKVRTEIDPSTVECTLMQELKENTVSLTLQQSPQALAGPAKRMKSFMSTTQSMGPFPMNTAAMSVSAANNPLEASRKAMSLHPHSIASEQDMHPNNSNAMALPTSQGPATSAAAASVHAANVSPVSAATAAAAIAQPANGATAATVTVHSAAAMPERGLSPIQLENLRKMTRIAQAVAPDTCPHANLVKLAKNMMTPMNEDQLMRFENYIISWIGQQQPVLVQQLQQQQQLQRQQQLQHQQQQHFHLQRQMLLQQTMLQQQQQQQEADSHPPVPSAVQAGSQRLGNKLHSNAHYKAGQVPTQPQSTQQVQPGDQLQHQSMERESHQQLADQAPKTSQSQGLRFQADSKLQEQTNQAVQQRQHQHIVVGDTFTRQEFDQGLAEPSASHSSQSWSSHSGSAQSQSHSSSGHALLPADSGSGQSASRPAGVQSIAQLFPGQVPAPGSQPLDIKQLQERLKHHHTQPQWQQNVTKQAQQAQQLSGHCSTFPFAGALQQQPGTATSAPVSAHQLQHLPMQQQQPRPGVGLGMWQHGSQRLPATDATAKLPTDEPAQQPNDSMDAKRRQGTQKPGIGKPAAQSQLHDQGLQHRLQASQLPKMMGGSQPHQQSGVKPLQRQVSGNSNDQQKQQQLDRTSSQQQQDAQQHPKLTESGSQQQLARAQLYQQLSRHSFQLDNKSVPAGHKTQEQLSRSSSLFGTAADLLNRHEQQSSAQPACEQLLPRSRSQQYPAQFSAMQNQQKRAPESPKPSGPAGPGPLAMQPQRRTPESPTVSVLQPDAVQTQQERATGSLQPAKAQSGTLQGQQAAASPSPKLSQATTVSQNAVQKHKQGPSQSPGLFKTGAEAQADVDRGSHSTKTGMPDYSSMFMPGQHSLLQEQSRQLRQMQNQLMQRQASQQLQRGTSLSPEKLQMGEDKASHTPAQVPAPSHSQSPVEHASNHTQLKRTPSGTQQHPSAQQGALRSQNRSQSPAVAAQVSQQASMSAPSRSMSPAERIKLLQHLSRQSAKQPSATVNQEAMQRQHATGRSLSPPDQARAPLQATMESLSSADPSGLEQQPAHGSADQSMQVTNQPARLDKSASPARQGGSTQQNPLASSAGGSRAQQPPAAQAARPRDLSDQQQSTGSQAAQQRQSNSLQAHFPPGLHQALQASAAPTTSGSTAFASQALLPRSAAQQGMMTVGNPGTNSSEQMQLWPLQRSSELPEHPSASKQVPPQPERCQPMMLTPQANASVSNAMQASTASNASQVLQIQQQQQLALQYQLQQQARHGSQSLSSLAGHARPSTVSMQQGLAGLADVGRQNSRHQPPRMASGTYALSGMGHPASGHQQPHSHRQHAMGFAPKQNSGTLPTTPGDLDHDSLSSRHQLAAYAKASNAPVAASSPHASPMPPVQTGAWPSSVSSVSPPPKATPVCAAAVQPAIHTMPYASSSFSLGGADLLKAEALPSPLVPNFVRPAMHMQASSPAAPRWVHLPKSASPVQGLHATHLPHLRHLISNAAPEVSTSPPRQAPDLSGHGPRPSLATQAPPLGETAGRHTLSSPPGIVIADATGMDAGTAVDNAIAAAQQMARQQLAARLTAGGEPQPAAVKKAQSTAGQHSRLLSGSQYLSQQTAPQASIPSAAAQLPTNIPRQSAQAAANAVTANLSLPSSSPAATPSCAVSAAAAPPDPMATWPATAGPTAADDSHHEAVCPAVTASVNTVPAVTALDSNASAASIPALAVAEAPAKQVPGSEV